MDNNDPQYLLEEHPDSMESKVGFYIMPNSPETVYVTNGFDIDVMANRDVLVRELRALADKIETTPKRRKDEHE